MKSTKWKKQNKDVARNYEREVTCRAAPAKWKTLQLQALWGSSYQVFARVK